MNSNLFHNILNVVIALLAAMTAFLIATGCVALPAGVLECSKSWLNPAWTTMIVSVLSVVKILVNVVRDGLVGLAMKQPPVRR